MKRLLVFLSLVMVCSVQAAPNDGHENELQRAFANFPNLTEVDVSDNPLTGDIGNDSREDTIASLRNLLSFEHIVERDFR